MKLIFIILSLFTSSYVFGAQKGTATIFMFFYGVALENNEVLIDGKKKYFTDEDGSIDIVLEVGKHQVEFFAKDKNAQNLGYGKKNIEIKANRDTQLITTFTRESTVPFVDVDTPVGELTQQPIDLKVTGVLNGVVLSSNKNLPIANARVFVKGTSIDTKTDKNGKFSVEIPANINVSISVVHSEYSAGTINGIKVAENARITKELKLTPASMELEEFIVLAPKVQGSIASVMAEEKESNAITNIVGADSMSKKGDSDAAGAIKRVTGVTLVDGTDVYVRGLGGRYSNVELNSLPLPSPDTQRRTVPLNIFPASVIGSMKVQKSATADIPASFGGGYVDIRTKDTAKESYIKLSSEIKSNSNVGTLVDSYNGSSNDKWGKDNGYRAIPQEILDASKVIIGEQVPQFDSDKNEEYTKAITKRQLATIKKKLPYGNKFAAEGAYFLELADKHELSFFANYAYGQDYKYRNEKYYKYAYQQKTDSLYKEPEQYGDIFKTMEKFSNSGVFNTHYNFADVFHVKYTKLFSQISEKVTKIADGIANSDDDWKIRYNLNWEEKKLAVDQLNTDFKYELFAVENELTFGIEKASADLNQPSNYKYAYLRDLSYDGEVQGAPYLDKFSPNVFLNLSSKDTMDAFYLKNKIALEFFDKSEYLEFGISKSSKTRTSRYNKYLMQKVTNDFGSSRLTDDIDTIYQNHIHNSYDDIFSLDISFQPAYWHDAQVDETNYNLNLFLKPLDKVELLMGLKQADFKQTTYQYTNDNNLFNPIEKVPESLAYKDLLPSLSFKYKFNPKNQLNFSYSKTYIVPDLREFAEVEYFHPYDVATVKGNPNLTHTTIKNYDLKYSHYFSDIENMTLGLFYKYLNKPIEDVQLPSSSLPRYGYDNADNAVLYGIEMDGRKNFDFIDSTLKNYYVSGNVSFTKSDVTLREEQLDTYTTNHRNLQGLSPTVLNLSMGYDSKKRKVTLSYNKMGARIRKVGMIDAKDEYPDYYEVPPQIVDFVWIEKFSNSLTVKLKIQNILDEKIIWYQGSKDNITNSFKKGSFYSLSLSYKY